MKELSIEEKAKRYDEVIERAKEAHNNAKSDKENGVTDKITGYTIQLTETIFPELKESGDDEIRKWLVEELYKSVNSSISKGFDIDMGKKALVWLEKQGNLMKALQISNARIGELIEKNYYLKEQLEKQGEQKPTDKVEPKFKNGQWIVWQNKCYKVNYNGCGYELIDQNGLSTSLEYVTVDENAHLWTIQDAKDGDVLAFYSEYRGNKMVQVGMIIEKYVGKHGGCSNTFKIYVGVNWDNNLQIGLYMGCSDIRPATKEQRDALMKAMGRMQTILSTSKRKN